MQIFRHDRKEMIGSDLDPIEDILNLITTLKSRGYTCDLLRQKHNFTSVAEINKTSKLIALHVENALALSEQAYKGSHETCFLPLYYSTLNLSKVALLFYGKREELEKNRWHGARYKESEMTRTFLNERIEIKNSGTIPLLYRTLTGKYIPKTGIKVTLENIYSRISSIGAEYFTITNDRGKMFTHQSHIVADPNGHYLKITILNNSDLANPPKPRMLRAYSRIKLVRPIKGQPYYESRRIKGAYAVVEKQLLSEVNRILLSDESNRFSYGNWYSYTPVDGRQHIFPEEMSVMMAFFHLSNVVRYNPEHLYKLKDSRYWALMLALRKHGFLRFVKLMWGNYNRLSFDII